MQEILLSHPLIILVGPSGSGKSTAERALTAHGFQRGISLTTRAPRAGEAEGVDYHFVAPAAFEALEALDGLADHIVVGDTHYGLARTEVDAQLATGPVVLVLEPVGIAQVKRHYPGRVTTVYLKPPSSTTLQQRRQARGDSEASLADPVRAALDARITRFEPEADHVVVTHDPAQTVAALLSVLNRQKIAA
jgi:guanylate kinase